MADNITIPTTGSGTATPVVATDDVGSVHYQRIKLVGGADGAATRLDVAEDEASAGGDLGIVAMVRRTDTPATQTGNDGDWEALQISGGKLWTTALGKPFSVQTDITRPADTAAYGVNDCLSDSTSAPTSGGFTLTSVARVSGGSALITDVIVTSSNDPATPLQGEVFLFNTSVTNVNDNAAFVVSDTEIKTCVGKVPFALEDVGNNDFYHAQNLNMIVTCSGSANLRFLIRVKNAYTPTNNEVITVIVKGLQLD